MRLATFLASLLFLVGCAGPAAVPDEPASSPDTLALDAPMWSREGLEAQPRMNAFTERVPPEMGYSPGTTAWTPAQRDLPDVGTAATPGALLSKAAAALPSTEWLGQELWEQVLRIHQDETGTAIGVILHWGLMDDSVIGHDLRVWMQQDGDAWHVERLEERYHCARGVSEGDLCI